MNVADKGRVIKLLGMLGSAFDGERANATTILQRMAEERKMSLTELIAAAHGGASQQAPPRGQQQQRKPPPPPPPPDPEPSFQDVNDENDLLRLLKQCADKPSISSRVLTAWELNFAADVSARYSRDYELSEKQLVIVEKILRKAQRVFT